MLEILVGVPGSGKSTYAQKRVQEAVEAGRPGSVAVLSFETIRRTVFGCGYVPEINEPVYDFFYQALDCLLKDLDRVVLVDNMNLTHRFRERCAVIARAFGHAVHAIEFPLNPEECWRRVVKRGSPVIERGEFDRLVARREEDRKIHGTSGVDEWWGVLT